MRERAHGYILSAIAALLPNNRPILYSLFVMLLLSQGLSNIAHAQQSGSVYATAYQDVNVGANSDEPYNKPRNTLGPPNGGGHSLGWGGSIVLFFGENAVSPSGDAKGDIHVIENNVPESVFVDISTDGQNWIPAGSVGTSNANGGALNIDGISETNVVYPYIRLTDTDGRQTGAPYGGADIDAVSISPAPPEEDKEGGCNNKKGEDGNRGNPCNVASGNKYQAERDFVLPGLSYTRYYNSRVFYDSNLGIGWTSTYHKRLIHKSNKIVVLRSSGYSEAWQDNGGILAGDLDSSYLLTNSGSGNVLTHEDGRTETYNNVGLLVSESTSEGLTTTFTYSSADQLLKVYGPYGHSLTFEYDRYGRVKAVADDEDIVITYTYNGILLTKVTYADGSNRKYKYEDPNYFAHLTGIVDENGDRYATWEYDSEGRAISSEHADTSGNGGQEHMTFSYDSATQTTVTDAAGTIEVLTFDENLGTKNLIHQIFTHDGKGISQVYDANNNLIQLVDEEGRITTYLYNTNNQKISMTQAANTALARTTTYEYVSADIDLVTKTTQPSIVSGLFKQTITAYDANLNITSVTINGFDQSSNSISRTTTFTHDALGKVTSVNGPRTDVNDTSNISY